MEQDKNTLKHFINIGAGTFINLLLGLISTPLITRIADPSEYGQLAIFNSYADIALAFVYIGLDRGLVRFFYSKDDLNSKRSILRFCFILPIICGLIISLGYILLVKLNIIPSKFSFLICLLLVIYILVTIWNKISSLTLTLTYKTKEFSICTIVQKIVYVLFIILYAAVIKKDYLVMLILASIVSIAFAAFIGIILTRDYWKFKDIELPNNSKEIIKYSYPFIVYALMDALLDSMDKLALEHFCSDYEVGVYTSALNLVGIFLIIKTIFETMWFPMQTEHFVKEAEDTTFIQNGNRYITIILMFVGINVTLFKDLICYFLGEAYRGANQIIPFLFLASCFYAISDTTISGIDYSKKSYLHALIGCMSVAVNYLACITFIPRFGARGAAIATCIAFGSYLVFRVFFSNKYYYVDYGIKKLLILSIFVIAYSAINTFMSFGVLSVVGYFICLFVMIVLYKEDIVKMYQFFKNSLFPNK